MVFLIEKMALEYLISRTNFARSQRAQSRNVTAYRTELATLLGISRKKVSVFPSHLLSARSEVCRNAFTLTSVDPQDESGNRFSTSPILVSTLPVESQQTSVLEALLNNLLLHHAGIDEETLYAYGCVEFITFLSALTLSHLLASVDPQLSFMAHSARRNSELFFKMFNIESSKQQAASYVWSKIYLKCTSAAKRRSQGDLLRKKAKIEFVVFPSSDFQIASMNFTGSLIAELLLRTEGFSRRSFAPPISLPKKIPHEKRLKELNIVNGLLYAISIRPHRCVTLGNTAVGAYKERATALNARCLLPFAYWLHIIGKQQASRRMCKVLNELCPESASVALRAVDGACKIGELSGEAVELAFLAVLDELQHGKGYGKYKETIKTKRNS